MIKPDKGLNILLSLITFVSKVIKLDRHIKIDEKLHRELTKLKGELGKKTYNQVIWELLIAFSGKKEKWRPAPI